MKVSCFNKKKYHKLRKDIEQEREKGFAHKIKDK